MCGLAQEHDDLATYRILLIAQAGEYQGFPLEEQIVGSIQ
jgi:hypothetical protein